MSHRDKVVPTESVVICVILSNLHCWALITGYTRSLLFSKSFPLDVQQHPGTIFDSVVNLNMQLFAIEAHIYIRSVMNIRTSTTKTGGIFHTMRLRTMRCQNEVNDDNEGISYPAITL
uniref:Secreted protein n=1 Tax=Ascaris lumbricoides TaxID=6252 RepID=A0A0M3HXG6_ASCLU